MSDTRPGRRPGQPNYTPEQKEAAIVLYREKGQAEAHRLTSIPVSTLARWASAAGVRAPVTPQSANLPNVRQVAAEVLSNVEELTERAERAELAEDYDPDELSRMWLDIARLSYLAYTSALTAGADMAAQRLNNCLGTATDKLQLLNGRATSRGEKLTNPDEATSQLLSIFGAIRARGEGASILTAHSAPAERVPGDHMASGPVLGSLGLPSAPPPDAQDPPAERQGVQVDPGSE